MAKINFEHITLPKGGTTFIAIFLRFEFALKEDGFCLEDGGASVDWGRVTKHLGSDFYATIRESGNADTIMKRPPKKQIFRNHRLDWEFRPPPRNIHELFEAVKRVRNNLVHGGKSGDPEDDPDDPRRNEKLINEAQWIVEQALLRMDNVRGYFEGRY